MHFHSPRQLSHARQPFRRANPPAYDSEKQLRAELLANRNRAVTGNPDPVHGECVTDSIGRPGLCGLTSPGKVLYNSFMTTLSPPLSPPSASPFEPWYDHFLENNARSSALPWHDSYRLNGRELRVVARSIQQFQLGEWARGRG